MAVGLLIPAGIGPTAGYVEQREIKMYLAAKSPVKCDVKAVVTATVVRLKNGKPVANQTVNWSFKEKASAADELTRTSSTTNRQGVTTTKIDFGPKAGKRVVRARIPGLKPTITVRCRGGLS
jgi:hypothetical protein